MTPEHVVRAMVDDDRGFVSSAWFAGAREVEPTCYVSSRRYDTHQRQHVDWCLDNASTLLACHPDAPDELFAFVCSESLAGVPVVHWIYVRRMWRRMGIAASLLRHATGGSAPPVVISTQWSKHSDWIRRRIRLVFDPYLVSERMAAPCRVNPC